MSLNTDKLNGLAMSPLPPARGSAAALKQQVSKILMDTLQGSEPRYRMDGYIRWGLVEREIHQAIDAALNEKPQNEKGQR